MILNMFVSLRVFLIVLVTCMLSFSQLVDKSVETDPIDIMDPIEVPEADPPSELICTTCTCEETVVNCSNMNITAPFELIDWDGLASFNPIAVDLSQNTMTSFSRISKLPIQVLNISNCDIEDIEVATFMYLEDLKSLDLSRNKIPTSKLNKMILCGPLDMHAGPSPFKQMQNLSLAYNDIHSLPQDFFAFMGTLTFLDLSGNPLAYIDQVTMGVISDLVHLKRLALSSCELESLPEGLLRRHRKLQWLDLSDNRFTTIPLVLQEAPKLVFLSLDKNPIQTISGKATMSKLTSLKELNLCRMSRLQNVTSQGLGGLTNLEILRMNYNPRLTNLSADFLVWEDEEGEEQWPMVKELYLNNNNLTTIDSTILDSWNDLVTGDFSNNPYVCDCHSQWMVNVLTPMLISWPQNNSVSQMACKKPPYLKGQTLAALNNSSKILTCTESENFTEQKTANLAIILGILIGIIATFPIVLILVLLWKRGYFAKYCRGRQARKPSYPYHDEENEYL